MRESYIEKRFKMMCERHGMRVFKMSTQFESGISDRHVVLNGYSGWCELKAPGKKMKPHQEAFLKNMQLRGCFVGVVDNPNDIATWIGEFLKHIKEKKNEK